MLAAIHEDLPIAVNVAFKEEVDMRGILHDSPRIRCDARNPGRQAIRLRIVLGLPLLHEDLRRGQQWNGFAWSQALRQIADRTAARPHAG